MRKRDIHIFCIVIAGIIIFVLFATNVLSHNFSTRSGRTTAHVVLNLEKDAGLPVSRSDYELLDAVIGAAVSEVVLNLSARPGMKQQREGQSGEGQALADQVLTRQEARWAFMVIDAVLTRNNIVHGVNYSLQESLDGVALDQELKVAIREMRPGVHEKKYSARVRRFLDENMEKMQHIRSHIDEDFHLLNCEYMSILYKSIFEAMGQRLSIVKAPKHSFVRWEGEGVYLDWETTSGMIYTDDDYKGHFGITDEEIANGVFLRPLDGREVLAIEYLYLGNRHINRARAEMRNRFSKDAMKDYSSAIGFYDKAIDANLSFATAYNNRAMAYHEYSYYVQSVGYDDESKSLKRKAMHDIQRAVDLYPNDEFRANLSLISSTSQGLAPLHN